MALPSNLSDVNAGSRHFCNASLQGLNLIHIDIVSIDYIPNELPNQGYVTRHYPFPTSKRVSSHSLYITIEQIKVSANDLN